MQKQKTKKVPVPIYGPIVPLANLVALVRTNYRHQKRFALERPTIVLCNHVTDWDPILVAVSVKEPLSFVASEHILHWGVFSRIIEFVAHPIIRRKATVASVTALNIARRIRAGGSVCIFAEGDRTYNGVTGPLFFSTAKLIKMTGAQLVTFRLEGGYLASPRWGRGFRRGRFTGHAVGRYAPEDLAAKSPEEIDALIAHDLYEDAYARQRENAVPYRGKNLAEGLETALFFCPHCGRLDTLRTSGNKISCDCGLSAEYLETGFLSGIEPPYNTVAGWDAWQREVLLQKLNEIELRDNDAVLLQTNADDSRTEITRGALCMTKDALSVGEKRFSMDTVTAVSICGRCGLVFSADGQLYEIKRESEYNAYKYRTMHELIRANAK